MYLTGWELGIGNHIHHMLCLRIHDESLRNDSSIGQDSRPVSSSVPCFESRLITFTDPTCFLRLVKTNQVGLYKFSSPRQQDTIRSELH